MLRVENLLWKGKHSSIHEYLDDQLMNLDPLMYPIVLGLRLAETFEFGRRYILVHFSAEISFKFC